MDLALLRQHAAAEGLTDHELQRLVDASEPKQLAASEVVCAQGAPGLCNAG